MMIVKWLLALSFMATMVFAQSQPWTIKNNEPKTLNKANEEIYRKMRTARWSVLQLEPLASAPGSPKEGDIYCNSSDHKLYFYNGTSWVDLTI